MDFCSTFPLLYCPRLDRQAGHNPTKSRAGNFGESSHLNGYRRPLSATEMHSVVVDARATAPARAGANGSGGKAQAAACTCLAACALTTDQGSARSVAWPNTS